MKISIIVPSYNQQQYLPDALESILAQTVKPFEILVINDGSTDQSLLVAKAYEKHGVKVIAQVNKGLSSARNTGIMNATGDYCFFCDSDDMMVENCLEEITKVIEKTNADIVAPSFKCFGLTQNDVILGNPTIEEFKTANRIGYFSAVRRSKLLEVGGYSPRMTWGYEDYHLWFDLLKRGAKLVTIPEILMLYRTKEKSMIHESMEHHVELMTQIAKDFPDIFPEVVEVKTPLPQ